MNEMRSLGAAGSRSRCLVSYSYSYSYYLLYDRAARTPNQPNATTLRKIMYLYTMHIYMYVYLSRLNTANLRVHKFWYSQ